MDLPEINEHELMDYFDNYQFFPLFEKHWIIKRDEFYKKHGFNAEFSNEELLFLFLTQINDVLKLYAEEIEEIWIEDYINSIYSPVYVSNFPDTSKKDLLLTVDEGELNQFIKKKNYSNNVEEFVKEVENEYQEQFNLDVKPIICNSHYFRSFGLIRDMFYNPDNVITKEMLTEWAGYLTELAVLEDQGDTESETYHKIQDDIAHCSFHTQLKILAAKNEIYQQFLLDESGFDARGKISFNTDQGGTISFDVKAELLNFVQEATGENALITTRDVKPRREQMFSKMKEAYEVNEDNNDIPPDTIKSLKDPNVLLDPKIFDHIVEKLIKAKRLSNKYGKIKVIDFDLGELANLIKTFNNLGYLNPKINSRNKTGRKNPAALTNEEVLSIAKMDFNEELRIDTVKRSRALICNDDNPKDWVTGKLGLMKWSSLEPLLH